MINSKTTTSLAIFLSLSFLLFLTPDESSAGAPTDFVKGHTSGVVELLRLPESEGRTEELSQKLHHVINFRILASRALKGYWEKRTAEEQQQFLDLLEQLLRANYSKKLRGRKLGEDYTIEYLEEKVSGDRALVATEVVTEKNTKPVEYKLMNRDSGWIVYDIVIDDVSLEETYRDSYTKIIEEDGWDTLIQRMKDRIKELEKKSDDEEE